MLALITNDDGIDSPGLLALARVAVELGCEIVVAAPVDEASGASASIIATEGTAVTAAGGRGRIRVDARTLEGIDAPTFAVHAAPGMIAMLAAHGAFGDRPDVVLSGINRGANVGRSILHSGTVGAALTAGLGDSRGLAVSLAVDLVETGDPHWGTAAAMVPRVLAILAERPVGTVFNLNVPNTADAEGLELRETPLAEFGIVQTTVIERGEHEVQLAIGEPPHSDHADTDSAVLAAGAATITSIRAVGEAEERVFR